MTNKKKKQQPIQDLHDEYGFSEGDMTMGMGASGTPDLTLAHRDLYLGSPDYEGFEVII